MMHTQCLTNDDLGIQTALDLLYQNCCVALPTETVYGLAARALSFDAVQAIYHAKQRPLDNPLILHVSTLDDAWPLWDLNHAMTSLVEELAKAFWPGPLTIVAPRSHLVPDFVCAHLPSVAVRVPAHPVMQTILRAIKEPLAAPSANASGRPSSTTAEHVLTSLNGRIAAVLDAGACSQGMESTVVDIGADPPLLLRHGALSSESLMQTLHALSIRTPGTAAHVDDASPGLRHRHYAPLAGQIRLVSLEALQDLDGSTNTVILLRECDREKASRIPLLNSSLQHNTLEILPNSPIEYMAALYAALYRIEIHRPDITYFIDVPNTPQWYAVRDRLLRAST